MNKYVKAMIDGSRQGIRETPRLYFAPLRELFGWMYRVTEKYRNEPGKSVANHRH